MAFDGKSLDNYVDVATRIAEFRALYPSGYLAPIGEPYRVQEIGDRVFIVVIAGAYREPGDPCPGVGMAWEPFPGRTPYTRDSELMNAETSAWGRAIIALGAADSRKGIASQEEVRNRQAERDQPEADGGATRGSTWQPPANPSSRKADRTRGPLPDDQWTTAPPDGQGPETRPGTSTPDQWRQIAIRLGERGLTDRADRLKFCNEVISDAFGTSREVGSAKELSFREAVEVLRVAAG